MSRILCLIAAFSCIAAAPASAPQTSFSLDGITLGSTLVDAITVLGTPTLSNSPTYEWTNSFGGTVTVVANPDGHISLIDVLAGKAERRQIDAAGGGGTLGESGHVNFIEPSNAVQVDSCGAGIIGAPCLALTLTGGVELVANFGKDNGFADWALSELVLGNRDLLISSGRVIAGQ